jgi:osmoprotectant transport system permease protein
VHLRYTVAALALGMAMALPLAFVAYRWPRLYPPLLALTNVLYAIPAIAMFVMLAPWLGFTNDRPIVVAMAIYTLVILLRNIVEGLRAAPAPCNRRRHRDGLPTRATVPGRGTPAGHTEHRGRPARGRGVDHLAHQRRCVIGRGGLGRLFDDGFTRNISIQVWAGLGAIVVLALAFDALIVAAVGAHPVDAGPGRGGGAMSDIWDGLVWLTDSGNWWGRNGLTSGSGSTSGTACSPRRWPC